ncbi:MAG: putative metalloprotease CJM1_0395 family protein [Planctomycetota bacterium]
MRLRPTVGIGTSEPTERGGRDSHETSAIDRLRPTDKAEFSPEALHAAEASLAPSQSEESEATQPGSVGTPHELSEEERREVEDLTRRDREVRTHEQAHKAAAGPYGGAISYEYQTGPDGKRYASGGSVPIDVSPIPDDPRATVQKMRQVRGAALAPAEPSSADRQVAALAQRQLAEAQRELSVEKREELSGAESASPDTSPNAVTGEGVAGETAGESSSSLNGELDQSQANRTASSGSATVASSIDDRSAEATAAAVAPEASASEARERAADPRLVAPLAAYGRGSESSGSRAQGRSIDVRG